MKLIYFNLFLLVFNLFTIAQVKPNKTFDHEKFGKKVYGNFSAGMDQSIFLPDDKALEYISARTGRTIDELKAERELNKQYLSDDKVALQKENAGGKMVLKVEVVKIDDPKLTMGNIIIHAGDKKMVLGNCIQTDMTWVLGNYMMLDGSSIPVRTKQVTKEEGNTIKPVATATAEPSKEKAKYSNNTAPSGTSGNNFINEKLFDKPMRGYYMDLNGKIVDAVIKYQSPEMMNSPKSTLLIYKTAYNEPGFTEDESNNFVAAKLKQEVLVFFVNGHVYVPVDGDKWCILLKEGAIRQSVYIFKSQTGSGKTGFGESQFIHKHAGKSMAVATMGLGFKGNMANMVEDNKELATKIENKEEGYKFLQYTKIIGEYNAWFDKQYPNKLNYIYK
ncbi:MAG: hypothetical protein KBG47_01990 [Bacteroidia bacterium]|nr:hypothetical protein [Bacteroidia bacterium]